MGAHGYKEARSGFIEEKDITEAVRELCINDDDIVKVRKTSVDVYAFFSAIAVDKTYSYG